LIKNKIQISIITLSKNNHKNFLKTLLNIKSQKAKFNFEWLIIDGSNKIISKNIISEIDQHFHKNNKQIKIKYINSNKLNIEGIYNCMNFGKKIARGNFIIFLNSGDIFFNKNSLSLLYENSLKVNYKNSLIFGQANIVSPNKINWNFPGNRLKDIYRWISFFEPNHQSMLVSSSLAKKFDFPLKYSSLGDGYWKRNIIKSANDITYIKTPIVKFFLDGISSSKPKKKIFKNLLLNKNISILRKIVFCIKYFLPKKLFFLYHLLQKYKAAIIDFLF